MAKKSTALAGIFDDEPMLEPSAAQTPEQAIPPARPTARPTRTSAHPASRNHGSKKPVLIHIPEDMHRTLRQLSVEEGGEPLTTITERMLRQYLVSKGHTKFAP